MKRKVVDSDFSGYGFWLRVNKSLRKHWFTQDMLAKRLGVITSTLRGWSYRKQFPDIETIYKIANILEEPFNYLVFGTIEDPATTNQIKLGKYLYPLVLAISEIIDNNNHHYDTQ